LAIGLSCVEDRAVNEQASENTLRKLPWNSELDLICDRFEAAWDQAGGTGEKPRIEDYLGDVSGSERLALLHELIGLEAGLRREQGEQPLLSFPSADVSLA
jgi:hypothetical protein